MKVLKEDLKMFDIKAHSLRGKEFFKGIVDFRAKILPQQKYRIRSPEQYQCYLCKKSDGHPFLEWEEGYQLFQCSHCGAVCPNISLEEEQKHIEEVYNTDIYYEKFVREIHSQYEYRKQRFGAERYGYIVERLNLSPKDIKVLDVGCGAAYFLSYLKDQGVAAKGLEVNPRAARYCQEIGLNVKADVLENEPDETYDVIVMFDVLEHLSDPIKVFKTARTKLKEGGYLIAYTPSIHSVGYELMGAQQNTLLPFEHLCFFNPQSFEYLAQKTQLKIFSLETYGFDVMDYLLMKEYQDQISYTKNLHNMMILVQGILDKAGVSNHFRLTLQKTANK